ncbi:MAG: class II aldolase/adducin family protein, partial [Chlorobi bacterium]|nr:class II aldolase/adducin family protein [Chlorobiota bacterium]
FSYNETNNTIIGKGKKQPSSESIMHYFIYDNNPEINAVFHGHSAEILQYAEKLRIPITEKEEPYGTIKAAKEVLKSLKKHNFIVMRNHGFVSCGKTAEEAGKNVLEVLNMCKTFKQ